jgi:hypothetical protein
LDKDFCLASGLCWVLAWLGGRTPLSEVVIGVLPWPKVG